jgi:tetratricopeptide (TPR) repeat protein
MVEPQKETEEPFNPDVVPQTLQGKVQACFYFKAKGNDWFKQKEYQKAISTYNKAILYLKAVLPGDNAEVNQFAAMSKQMQDGIEKDEAKQQELKELQVTCLLNQAQCFFQLKRWEKVVEKASLSITLKVQVKALFRRAKAYEQLGNLDKAIEDYYACMKADPSDQNDIQKELAKAKARQKQKDQKDEQKMKGFLEGKVLGNE